MTIAPDDDFEAAVQQSGRGPSFRFVQPHNLAFWLYVLAVLVGVIYFFDLVDDGLRAFPTAFVLAVVLWALYLVPWVLFIRHEEMYDPEPAKLAFIGFIWGGFVATFAMAIEANTAIKSLVGKMGSPELARDWGDAISAPFIEETSKAMGIVVVVLLGRRFIRTVFDGAVLGAFVGLGFQVLEDLVYSINSAVIAGPGNEIHAVFLQFLGRGFMAGLWSHALYSGLVGAGIAYFLTRTDRSSGHRYMIMILLGVAAWLLHFVWDSPFVNGPNAAVFGWLAKLIIYPLVFIWAIRWAARQRRDELGVILAGEVDTGTLTERDVSLLVMSRHERRKELHDIAREDGRAARHDERVRLRAARDLANALAKSGGSETDDVRNARSEIAALEPT
ncbi:MAG: PrsW family intramembrane metalloprotease [Microthrixaceae bacterium]